MTTKNNHIGAIYQAAPQKATNLMVQLLALQRGKSLESELAKYPTKEFDTDDEYTWDVIGSSRRNIPLVEVRTTINGNAVSSNTTVGAGTEPFYLVFPEDWFAEGEVLMGHKEEYLFRILGDGRNEGTNCVYKVELMGGNTTGVVVGKDIKAGDRFSIEYAPVEREFSRKVGDRLILCLLVA